MNSWRRLAAIVRPRNIPNASIHSSMLISSGRYQENPQRLLLTAFLAQHLSCSTWNCRSQLERTAIGKENCSKATGVSCLVSILSPLRSFVVRRISRIVLAKEMYHSRARIPLLKTLSNFSYARHESNLATTVSFVVQRSLLSGRVSRIVRTSYLSWYRRNRSDKIRTKHVRNESPYKLLCSRTVYVCYPSDARA
jgi:hypothetical protein